METDITPPPPPPRIVMFTKYRPLKENKVKSTLSHNPHPYMNEGEKRKRERERERKQERKKESSRSAAVAVAAATPDSSSLTSKRSDLCGLFSPKSCILMPSLQQDQSSKYTLQAPFLSIYYCEREFLCSSARIHRNSNDNSTTTNNNNNNNNKRRNFASEGQRE
jgi:outer membrane biosynthesis protein TonB